MEKEYIERGGECKYTVNENEIEFEEGCLWEGCPWKIVTNKVVEESDSFCRHCKDQHVHVYRSYYGREYEKIAMICPRVVVALNEGTYNSTGVCLDCILEAAESLEG